MWCHKPALSVPWNGPPWSDLCASRWGSKFWTSFELTENVSFPQSWSSNTRLWGHQDPPLVLKTRAEKGFNVFALSMSLFITSLVKPWTSVMSDTPLAFQILVKPFLLLFTVLTSLDSSWTLTACRRNTVSLYNREQHCYSCCLSLFSLSVHLHFLSKFWKQIPAQSSWCSALLPWLLTLWNCLLLWNCHS